MDGMNKNRALLILETLMENETGTKKEALSAVYGYFKSAVTDDRIFTMSRKERQAEIDRILKECGYMRDRDNMTPAEREEAVRYYGEGLRSKTAG